MSYKVMVIDDDEQIVEALNIVLKKHGYTTILTTTADNILDFVKSTKPDIILLDIRLLDGDGLTITRTFKEDNLIKNIPVILISARVGTLAREELAGADLYLSKPFRMHTLLDALSSLLPSPTPPPNLRAIP